MHIHTIDQLIERTGPNFNLNSYLNARLLCIDIVKQANKLVRPGQNFLEITSIIEKLFLAAGISEFWHPTVVRIKNDTTKYFKELSDPKILTEKNDLCFIDVGPTINGHEADYGETFVIGGKNDHPLIKACELIFRETKDKWENEKLVGSELFAFANGRAHELGFELNPLTAGHRLGDFPHKIYSNKKLFELNFTPAQNLWVLEIHVVDKKNQLGAFFEDILGSF